MIAIGSLRILWKMTRLLFRELSSMFSFCYFDNEVICECALCSWETPRFGGVTEGPNWNWFNYVILFVANESQWTPFHSKEPERIVRIMRRQIVLQYFAKLIEPLANYPNTSLSLRNIDKPSKQEAMSPKFSL